MRIGLSYDQGTAKYPLYAGALAAAGARRGLTVEPIWLGGIGRPSAIDAVDDLDGIVVTGGADVEPWRYGFDDREGLCVHVLPERDEAELPVLRRALELRIPMLAICRGMQLLNVACGGSLIPDLPGHEQPDTVRHRVAIAPDSWLAARLGGLEGGEVSTAHHQAVDRLGGGLRIAAAAPDGVVEAIEWCDPGARPWLLAVQWHPERMRLEEPLSGALYEAFFDAVEHRSP